MIYKFNVGFKVTQQNLKIRPLSLSDVSQLAQLANNKRIFDNVRDHFPFPYKEDHAEAFIKKTLNENPRQTFGIEYEDALSGVIGLILQEDVYRKSAEVGFWIGEPFWGKGVATQALKLITDYGFNKLNLARIYAGAFEYNTGSMKVLEKNGFIKEGILKKAAFKNEQFYDEHRYYKLKDS